MFIRSFYFNDFEKKDVFPFNLGFLPHDEPLELDPKITVVIGDNGCGKSTLLESLALGVGLPTIASNDIREDETLGGGQLLQRFLRIRWTKSATRSGLFFRAEDLQRLVHRLDFLKKELDLALAELENELSEDALALPKGAILREKADLERIYGPDLNANSHGEAFLRIFEKRLERPGVYILDEPEASLSPTRQLALIGLISERVERGSQFILATHSPILMGLPEAKILQIEGGKIQPVALEETEHFRVTRAFLNDRSLFF